MAFSNLRSSSSLPNLLLSSLNLLLFLLSAASFAPLLLLRAPPASFGWALFAVSSATFVASSVGFYSHLTRHRLLFVAHVAFLLASSAGQALGFFSLLLLRPGPSLRLLGSARADGGREADALLGIEKGVMAAMFAVGSAVLVLECMVQSWWVREYEEVEAAAAASRKRGRRMARVEVVSEAMEVDVEIEGSIDERMKSKCDQESARNNIEV